MYRRPPPSQRKKMNKKKKTCPRHNHMYRHPRWLRKQSTIRTASHQVDTCQHRADVKTVVNRRRSGPVRSGAATFEANTSHHLKLRALDAAARTDMSHNGASCRAFAVGHRRYAAHPRLTAPHPTPTAAAPTLRAEIECLPRSFAPAPPHNE